MKINMEWLKQNGACPEAFPYASKIGELEGVAAVRRLIADDKLGWANWLIVKIMRYSQYVAYAIYAAEQVLHIFEEKYPDDDRPRKAIEAAKKCATLTAAAASIAASAAYAASVDVFAASSAAAFAASAAASAASAAAFSSASSAAASFASFAAFASVATCPVSVEAKREEMLLKILNYGLDLLEAK